MLKTMSYLIHALLELLGYHRRGLIGEKIDDRDYIAKDKVKMGDLPLPYYVDNLNTQPDDQKNIGACTAAAVAGVHQMANIEQHRNMMIFFSMWNQWKNQKEYPGVANDKTGDYIVNALKALKRYGSWYAEKYYGITGYAYVTKDEFKRRLADGYRIVTGTGIKKPMCDNKWVFRTGGKSGHCFAIVGYDDSKDSWICWHQWGSYGIKGTGRFYLKYGDEKLLFRSWIIYDDSLT